MPNIKNNAAAQETKRKLLNAAGEVFAEFGFERATIKDITQRAGVSVASVNYHFSDKNELYAEVVRIACMASLKAPAMISAAKPDADPRQQLHDFVFVFLESCLDPSRPAWYGTIINRELRQPIQMSKRMVDELFRPHMESLGALVRKFVGPRIPPNEAQLLCDSIIGQCAYFVDHHLILQRMYPELPPASQRIDEIADHITQFSLAAITGMYHLPQRAPGNKRPK